MLDGLRILLVEDDDVDRQRVHRAIKRAGVQLEVVDAHDIAAARGALEVEGFDCAVIDYNLPDGNAMELLELNREREDGGVPMVVLTGHDDQALAIEALQHGAEDYLVKDRFEADVFFRAIRYAIERARMRRDLERTNARLQRELEVGGGIQTSILPRDLSIVAGLDIAARMKPATEVGGDYYDVLPAADGCWLGIGDVAGHGMAAAIVALMTQSVIAGLVSAAPDATPAAVVTMLNDVLVDNVRHRLHQDEHVTFTLLRYRDDGRVCFAGAHEEIVIRRAAGGVEHIPTPGTWLAARKGIADVTPDGELTLAVGDVMVLYTDGVTEALDENGQQLGLEPISDLLEAHGDKTAAEIHATLWAAVETWTHDQDDDITLMVIRRTS